MSDCVRRSDNQTIKQLDDQTIRQSDKETLNNLTPFKGEESNKTRLFTFEQLRI